MRNDIKAIPLSPEQWLLPAAHRSSSSDPPRIVAIGGDGIGPEIVAAAVTCIRATGAHVDIVEPSHGAAALRAGGTAFPDELRAELERASAILFGAVDTGPDGHCRPILRHIRFTMNSHTNIRPALRLPGVPALTGIRGANLVIIRELSEGMYPGCEGDLAALTTAVPDLRDSMGRPVPAQGRFAVQIVTEAACRRIARHAALLAAHRRALGVSPGHVTIVTKANVLRQSDGLFHEICAEEIRAVAELECDHIYVDEAARCLVACPERFDVIVTGNLYGDILSDIAAEIMGGMPMAPSAGLGDGHAYFEPCHGSAPDISGKGIANPTATLFSGAMLLGYLGLTAHATRLIAAVMATIAADCKTHDLGGHASTSEFTGEICRRLVSE